MNGILKFVLLSAFSTFVCLFVCLTSDSILSFLRDLKFQS